MTWNNPSLEVLTDHIGHPVTLSERGLPGVFSRTGILSVERVAGQVLAIVRGRQVPSRLYAFSPGGIARLVVHPESTDRPRTSATF